MSDDNGVTEQFRETLRAAVEDSVSHEADWPAFHARLNAEVAAALANLRRRASGGYRATTAAGAAWWDYAARSALAAVPLGLAAALVLFVYLWSGTGSVRGAAPTLARVASAPRNDSARAAFESVLTGDAAPGAVMATLIPVPVEAIPADSAGGGAR